MYQRLGVAVAEVVDHRKHYSSKDSEMLKSVSLTRYDFDVMSSDSVVTVYQTSPRDLCVLGSQRVTYGILTISFTFHHCFKEIGP